MKNRSTKIAIIGLIAVLVMSLGALAVFAQDDTPSDSAPSNGLLQNDDNQQDTPVRPAMPNGRGDYHGWDRDFDGRIGSADDEALAAALGITVEELQAARQKVYADRLAQAVEDGYLTKDEANTMLAMQALKGYLDRTVLMAQALGISVEEFESAHDDGTLNDLLGDMTSDELQEKMQTAVEAAVQQAVTDNAITQEQADLVLAQIQNGLQFRGTMGPESFGGHHGGHGGRDFHGFRGTPQTDDAPSASPTGFGA
ncbi:MAG: hypothetical protein ACK2U0_18750 [Candidatus Promineifilaceae bacterium]|jgi:hypothetical protein